MRTLKLTLAYDGAAYAGWQVQPRDVTVQGTLEAVWTKISQETGCIVGSGRTDSGVHALGQVASMTTESKLTNNRIQHALNSELPDDISILAIEDAPEGFHATRDATSKRYRYLLVDGPIPDALERNRSWHVPHRLDAEKMHRAAQALVGEHDFSSFESKGAPRASSVRTVSELLIERSDASHLLIEIEADGFLYNMVRAIVGTLVDVGRGAQPEAWPAEALAAMNRKRAGMTAPPQGLFLVSVDYD